MIELRWPIEFNSKIYWVCMVSAYVIDLAIPDGLVSHLYIVVWLAIFFLRVSWLQLRLVHFFNATGLLFLLAAWPFFVRGDINHPVYELARISMYASIALSVIAAILLGWPWHPRQEQAPQLP
jgi:hypothetical protein